MKKILIIVVLIIIGVGVFLAVNKDVVQTSIPENTTGLNVSEDMERITFEYPEEYVLLEQSSSDQVPTLNKTLVIMQKADYDSIQRGEREGGEGPASITIQEFQNTESLTASTWAEENAQLSNFALIGGAVTETEIDGTPAIQYNADGLYANRNVVFVVDDLIYYLSGAYMDQDSLLYRDFDALVASVRIKE